MNPTRRELLWTGLFGAGLLGLRALATGLPRDLLLGEAAAKTPPAESPLQEPQFLILSTSLHGDPVNANAPGTYEHAEIQHSADPRMKKTALQLSGKTYYAAAPWASLPQQALDRTVFFHHATQRSAHLDLPKVLQPEAALPHAELLPAWLGRYLADALGTTQSQPLLLCHETGLAHASLAADRSLRTISIAELRHTLAAEGGALHRLRQLRNHSLDTVQAQLRAKGTRAQRQQVDRLALSEVQAQALSEQLLDNLATLKDSDGDGQVIAAATLIKLKVAPVVVIGIPFGGDNHFDSGFVQETEQTCSGVASIALLLRKLQEYGLSEQATFALVNVFGRTLARHGQNGRDHSPNHHTTVLIGKPFRGGVIGGVIPQEGDFVASAVDAKTGAADAAGDIPFAQTLASVGKTLGRGLGLPKQLVEDQLGAGKIVSAALLSA